MPEVNVNTSSPADLVNSAAGAAGTLAGWAISSLGKKVNQSRMEVSTLHVDTTHQLAASDMQTTIAQPSAPVLPPVVAPALNSSSFSAPPSIPQDRPSKAKGLQLGSKSSNALSTATLPDELAEEIAATETANAWGTDDLIDIHNDDDDWSAFESAPISPTPTATHESGSLNARLYAIPPSRPASKSPVPKSPFPKSPLPKSPSPVVYQTLPGSFDTPISTPPASQTPEPDWEEGNEWDATSKASAPIKKSGPPVPALSKEEKASEMARRKEERRLVGCTAVWPAHC